jgi:hypothetical protein
MTILECGRMRCFLFFLFLTWYYSSSSSSSSYIEALSTTGQVVLVMNAHQPLGKEMCRSLSKDPSVAATILACPTWELGKETMDELYADGGESLSYIPYDDTTNAEMSASLSMIPIVQYIQRHFGRLDVFVQLPQQTTKDHNDRINTATTTINSMTTTTTMSNDVTLALLPLLEQSTAPPKCIYILDSPQDSNRLQTLLAKEYPQIICRTMQSSSSSSHSIQQAAAIPIGWVTQI